MSSQVVSYLGNKNLKRAGIQIEFSEFQISEYIKCATNPEYFIENYIKIVHVDRGLVSFDLYSYQKKIVHECVNNRFVICKLPRQSGKSVAIIGIMIWYLLFSENYSIAILAHKAAQARELLTRLQLAYEHLPMWLQQGVVEWNKGSIVLENGSKILASATSSSAVRGTSQNMIYLDEFAHVQQNIQEEFFASTYPTISSGQTTKVIITSTPKGLNLFYKIWKDSEDGLNSYIRISVHWSETPGRDQKWKEETIRNTSEEQFRQEFECEFIGSSGTLISPAVLNRLRPIKPIIQNDHFRLFVEPTTTSLYAIVVDTSRGLGGDYSAYIVFDIGKTPYKVVATYRDNHIAPLMLPDLVYTAAKKFNDAFVLIETNDIGQQVADILHDDLEYENIIFTKKTAKNGVQVTGGFGGGTVVKGVRTTKTVKKVGCVNFKALVENDKIDLNDNNLIYELFRFVSNGHTYAAEQGTDDLVMCCVLFAWLMNQKHMKDISNVDYRKKLLAEREQAIEEDIPFFGVVDDRQPDEHKPVVWSDNFIKDLLT